MARVTKNRKVVNSKLKKDEIFTLDNAIAKAKELAYEKFDSTFRASFNLNVDPKHADQQLRGKLVLPHGTGKNQKVLAIVDGDNVEKAKKAGADFVGGDEMLTKIEREK